MSARINIKKIEIRKIFDFPKTNSKITKRFCNSHRGTIPVYASSKDENSTLGLIQDNLVGVKYYENCLSWNRNGSVGYVFVRNHKFATNEDHRALRIKDEYKDQLDKLYLKFEIEIQLFFNGFSFLNKCGVDKIKEVLIQIPIKNNGEFNLDKQKELAEKYIKIQELKNNLKLLLSEFLKLKVEFLDKYKTKSVPVAELFDTKKGNAKYTKKYIHDHRGEFPVYSSQTSNFGEIGEINTYDYDKKCFTWTTDGIYAGTVFYRDGKFSITTHCGILDIREKYKKKVDFEYLHFILSQTLPNYALAEWANKRVGIERMNEISVDIPIKKGGDFDLEKQKEIADRQKKVEQVRSKIKEDFEATQLLKVEVVEP